MIILGEEALNKRKPFHLNKKREHIDQAFSEIGENNSIRIAK